MTAVHKSNFKAILYMLLAVILFYVGDSLTKYVVDALSASSKGAVVVPILFIRVILGVVWLTLTSIFSRERINALAFHNKLIALRSFFYTITILSFALSFATTSDMTSVYLVSFLWPLIVMAMNFFYFKKSTISSVVFLNFFMFVGILIYYISNVLDGSSTLSFGISTLVPFATALGYASITLVGQQSGNQFNAISMTYIAFSYAAVVLLVGSVIQCYFLGLPDLGWNMFGLITGASLCSTLGFLAFSSAMQLGDESRVAPFDYTVILLSLSRNIFNGKIPTIYQIIGVVIVITGAFLMAFMKKRQHDFIRKMLFKLF